MNTITGITHGTKYGWQKRKCPCDQCQIAKGLYYAQRNAKRRKEMHSTKVYKQPAPHGSYKRYKRGCNCDQCKAANNQHKKDLKAERKKPLWSRRNTQQLALLEMLSDTAAEYRELQRQLHELIRHGHSKGLPISAIAQATQISHGTTKRIALSMGRYQNGNKVIS